MKPEQNESELAARFFLMHQRWIKGLALRYAPWPDVADDIVQEVFVIFIEKSDKWDLSDAKKTRNLLGTITRQAALRFWRRQRRSSPETLFQIAERIRLSNRQPDSVFRYSREIVLLKTAVGMLSPRERKIIQLYYYQNKPVSRIAEIMRMRPDTVCRALSRLRVKIRKHLKKLLQIKESDHGELD